MTSFADQMQGVIVPTTHAVVVDPPKFWYHNGVRQAKTPGNFYTKDTEFPQGLGEPWTTDDRFEGERGYSTAILKIAILAVRTQAFKKQEDPKAPPQWLPRWEQGASLYTEIMCLIEGYDGPAVWACKGLTGKAVTGKGGIIQTYQNGLLKEAIRTCGQGLPLWAFWLPVATKRTTDGKVSYEDTGFGSFITPPALHFPDNPLDTLFTGPEGLKAGEDALRQYPTWESFKRLPQNVIEGEVVSNVPQLPPGRNIPVPVTDDEY